MGFCLVALEMRHTCTQHGPDNLHARQAAGAEDAQEGVVRAAVLLQILPVPLGGIVDGHYVVCRRGKMRAQRLGVQCRAAQAGPRRGAGGAWGGGACTQAGPHAGARARSEERRVGEECVR